MSASLADQIARRRIADGFALALAEDWPALRDLATHLDDDEGDRFARGVTRLLMRAAHITKNWAPYFDSQWALPSSSWRQACREFGDRVAAWAVPAKPKAETPRRQLGRLAIRLVQAGEDATSLLRRLDVANATFDAPVSAADVGDIAIWAARTASGDRLHG